MAEQGLLRNHVVNQIAFVVRDIEAASEAFAALLGIPKPQWFLTVIQTGNFYNGKGRYAYMDTILDYKVIIELLEKFDT